MGVSTIIQILMQDSPESTRLGGVDCGAAFPDPR